MSYFLVQLMTVFSRLKICLANLYENVYKIHKKH